MTAACPPLQRIQCFHLDCKADIPFEDVRVVRPRSSAAPIPAPRATLMSFTSPQALRDDPRQFARYQEFLMESTLAADPTMTRCPKPHCQTPILRQSEDMKMCVCPKPGCGYSFWYAQLCAALSCLRTARAEAAAHVL